MARTASRTASVYTRVDPEIKSKAEFILQQLGIPMSNAVEMFLRQVVYRNGLPFEVTIPTAKPVAVGSLSKEQFDAEIQKGLQQVLNGFVEPAETVEQEMQARMNR